MAAQNEYKLIEIGDWCVIRDGEDEDVYADHLGCVDMGNILCWAQDDSEAVCFYCREPVPAEIQALVLLNNEWR